MASVDLTELWVHDATDLDDFRRFESLGESVTPSRRVEVREYAGGRTRAITGPARPVIGDWDVSLFDGEDLDWLESVLGALVLVRSPSGRNIWGVVADIPHIHVRKGQHFEGTITVQQVTFDESV